ncbi:MAG: hypothetical protein VX542_02870, partial [Cyanobacteriota bacterium]|nr:hypothetical protein [Cyanobacteriota bacterium]
EHTRSADGSITSSDAIESDVENELKKLAADRAGRDLDASRERPMIKTAGGVLRKQIPPDQYEALWWHPHVFGLAEPKTGKVVGSKLGAEEPSAVGGGLTALEGMKRGEMDLQRQASEMLARSEAAGTAAEYRQTGDGAKLIDSLFKVLEGNQVKTMPRQFMDQTIQGPPQMAFQGARAPQAKVLVYKHGEKKGTPVFVLDEAGNPATDQNGQFMFEDPDMQFTAASIARAKDRGLYQPGPDDFNPYYTVGQAEEDALQKEITKRHGLDEGDAPVGVLMREQGANILPRPGGALPAVREETGARAGTLIGNRGAPIRWIKKSEGEVAMDDINEVLST